MTHLCLVFPVHCVQNILFCIVSNIFHMGYKMSKSASISSPQRVFTLSSHRHQNQGPSLFPSTDHSLSVYSSKNITLHKAFPSFPLQSDPGTICFTGRLINSECRGLQNAFII